MQLIGRLFGGILLFSLVAVGCWRNPGQAGPANRLVFQVQAEHDESVDLELLIPVIQHRLKAAAVVRKFSVQPAENADIEVVVWTADGGDLDAVARIVTRPGMLLFAPLANTRDHAELVDRALAAEEILEEDSHVLAQWFPIAESAQGVPKVTSSETGVIARERERNGQLHTEALVVYGDASDWVTGEDLVNVNARSDGSGNGAIEFRLSKSGAGRMESMTKQLMPEADGFARRLAIILDGQLHSAPAVRVPIADRGELSGQFSEAEADEIVAVLRAGRLPYQLKLRGLPGL